MRYVFKSTMHKGWSLIDGLAKIIDGLTLALTLGYYGTSLNMWVIYTYTRRKIDKGLGKKPRWYYNDNRTN